ncbi:alpha/beta fold hydrolase [Hugenholtzia roseola]|uniref:alpha/beta fold hydrolase n=1 Tax=Hugenholtzia roseola TaxID=1002 RepID=UPI0004172BF0|nr:alpha/beta hydrolase [Hugenholtzia roseola]
MNMLQDTLVSASTPFPYQTWLYQNPEAAKTLTRLYHQTLQKLRLPLRSLFLETSFGKTHVLISGNQDLPPLLVLHGLNASAPSALEALEKLSGQYQLIGIDTIGQANYSQAKERLSVADGSYGRWLEEILLGLKIESAPFVSISYGAFVLQKLIAFAPKRIEKAIFVVPSGLANSSFSAYFRQLLLPLLRFRLSKKESDLKRFMGAFYTEIEAESLELHKTLLLGVKMDYRRPPELTLAEGKKLEAPVYALLAEDDVFFPTPQTLKRLAALFPHFKGYHILKDAKHVPALAQYEQMATQIQQWLGQK